MLPSLTVPQIAAVPDHPRWAATLAEDPSGRRLTIRDFRTILYDRGLAQASAIPRIPSSAWLAALRLRQRLHVLIIDAGEPLPWGQPEALATACRTGRVLATTVQVSLATSGMIRQPSPPRSAPRPTPEPAGRGDLDKGELRGRRAHESGPGRLGSGSPSLAQPTPFLIGTPEGLFAVREIP